MHEYSDPVTVQNDDEKCNKLVRMRPWKTALSLAAELRYLVPVQSSILAASSTNRVWQKKYPPKTFCCFLSNRLAFQREILPTYLFMLYAHNSFITNLLAYCGLKLAELQ